MWHKIKKHKYDYFLLTIFGVIISSPFLPEYGNKEKFPFVACIYTLAVISILGMILENRIKFVLLTAFYGGVSALDIGFHYSRSDGKELLDLVSSAMHSAVFVFLFVRLVIFLFRAKKVSSDHVKGGIAVYFLMGILWALLYRFVCYFDPAAFVFNNPTGGNLFYFSYVTLATLGYGDIVPATRMTQMLAVMEAMIGQVFLAVFIARLMGLYIGQETRGNEQVVS